MKFKFQYDNTLRVITKVQNNPKMTFKFQYDNTLSMLSHN